MSTGVVNAVDAYYIDMKCPNPVTIVQAGKQFDIDFTFRNMKPSDEVNSFDIVFAPEGGTPVTRKVVLDAPLTSLGVDMTVGGFVCDVLDTDIPYTLSVTNVNNTDVPQKGYGYSGELSAYYRVFPSTVYFEEATGSWCQFCYDGFLAMEYMFENYGDSGFNGVAIHSRDNYSDYPAGTFDTFYNRSISYPTGFYDRNFKTVVSPNKNGFEGRYQKAKSTPSLYSVSLSFEKPLSRTLEVNAEVRFGKEMENEGYALSYMLTENNLPGLQKTTSGSYVSVIYNDVARGGSIYDGIPLEDIPSTTVLGEVYTAKATIDLSYLDVINNSAITVLLLDAKTGLVLNTRRYPLNSQANGVSELEAADIEDAAPEYYNLQGVRVNNPSNGLYICRRGSKVSKVFIK